MMGTVEKLLEEHEDRVDRLNMRANDPASGMTLGEYEDKLAALRAETAAKIAQADSHECEYCQGGKKIETEIDGDGPAGVREGRPRLRGTFRNECQKAEKGGKMSGQPRCPLRGFGPCDGKCAWLLRMATTKNHRECAVTVMAKANKHVAWLTVNPTDLKEEGGE